MWTRSRSHELTIVLEALSAFGFRSDRVFRSEYANPDWEHYQILHLDMGVSLGFAVNPKRHDDRYILGYIGGCNGYDAEINTYEFRNPKKYYTAEEAIDYVFARLN